jgi:hypothetical protein
MEILSLLNQLLDVYTTTKDLYGDITRSSKYLSVPCRFQFSNQKTIGDRGDEVVSSCQVWLPYTWNDVSINIESTDVIVYNDKEYKIISIQNGVDIGGVTKFTKVFLR